MFGTRSTILRNRLAGLGLVGQTGLVTGVMIGCWCLAAPVAYSTSGAIGLSASAVGAGICWLGAVLALVLVALFPNPQTALYGVVTGMFARTMFPLILGVGLHYKVPSLAAGGMIFYILVFYMAILATETAITLAKIPPSTSRRAV